MRSRPVSPYGFTLLEVMIVVGIAALILAISVPFVERTIKRDAVYRAVHVVEDAIWNARATAIFNNAATDLVIRPQDHSVQVRASTPSFASPVRADAEGIDDLPGGGRAADRVRDFSRHAPKPFTGSFEEDVSIDLLDVNFEEFRDEEEARVRFHPNGTSDEFTIVMTIGKTARRKISLDVVTATPTIETIR